MGKVVSCEECHKAYRNLEALEDLRENDGICLVCNSAIEVEDWDRILASYEDDDYDDVADDIDEDDFGDDFDDEFDEDGFEEMGPDTDDGGGDDGDGDDDDEVDDPDDLD